MAEDVERTYHLGYAQARFRGLFNDLSDALGASWKAGTTITRYNRRWYLTKIVDETAAFAFGRIGFVDEDAASTLRFDPATNDFVHGDAPSGVVVPFAIQKQNGLIVFQLRPGVVRARTFTRALASLLNAANSAFVWDIQAFSEESDFSSWAGAFPIINRFDITVVRPNPHYFGADKIESAIEDIRLESIRLVGKARDGEPIDPSADLFQQAIDHVMRSYGKAKVRGMNEDGIETEWVKPRGTASGRVASKKTVKAVGPEEVPESVLQGALDQAPVGELHDVGDDDD